MAEYLQRAVEPLLERLLAELPAVLIVGPRASGKTTTAARLAASSVRLDRENEAVAFRADPDAALRGLDEPVLLDEWQLVPEVLGAVKRSVDTDSRPGRFIITGSVRAELDAPTWPGTGRVVRVPLYPLTVAEKGGRPSTPSLLDRLQAGDDLEPADTPDLRDYVQLALSGGFPDLLGLSSAARDSWIESYIDQLLTRDAALADRPRDPARLRRFLESIALNTAGLVSDQTLYEAAGIDRRTGLAYEQLLANLMVIESIPAWTTNRLKRLVLRPKRHLIDPALASGILRLDESAVLRDGDLLGRFLDTFVAAQLRTEVATSPSRPRLYHLRQEQGRRELDLLAELGAERVIGIEVKADSAPDRHDARHLLWLQAQLRDRFVAGVVLHTGPSTYRLGERITAAPISALWSIRGAA